MKTTESGVTMIELLMAIIIMSILLAVGVPMLGSWLQSGKIRTTADAIQNGLQLARIEAVKNNSAAMFSLTTTVDNTCATYAAVAAGASGVAANWTVTTGIPLDPTGACDTGAQVVHKRTASEGTTGALVTATQNTAAHSGQVTFNGLGQVSPLPANDIWFDVTNPAGGTCKSAGGNMTCLRVVLSPAGNVRLCNSSIVYSQSTPQGC